MQLVWPGAEHLPSYIAALRSGWSANSFDPAAATEELDLIGKNADAFLASQIDREAKSGPIKLPDGTLAKRIPGFRRWLWDGEFCGLINFRWQPVTEELPPHVLGHIGYAVVPAKCKRGYATQALAETLPLAKAEGLRYVEIITDPDNIASRQTIEANGGVLHEQFLKPAQYGSSPGLRYRIDLA